MIANIANQQSTSVKKIGDYSLCTLSKIYRKIAKAGYQPPLIDADVRGAGEPGVENEDAPEGGCAPESLNKTGVVVQPQPLAEPMHRVLINLGGRSAVIGGVVHTSAANIIGRCLFGWT